MTMIYQPTLFSSIGILEGLATSIAYYGLLIQVSISILRYPRLKDSMYNVVSWRNHVIALQVFIALYGISDIMRIVIAPASSTTAAMTILSPSCSIILLHSLAIVKIAVSIGTVLKVIPIIPHWIESINTIIEDNASILKSNLDSERKLHNFMSFISHEMRNPLFHVTSTLSGLEDFCASTEYDYGFDNENEDDDHNMNADSSADTSDHYLSYDNDTGDVIKDSSPFCDNNTNTSEGVSGRRRLLSVFPEEEKCILMNIRHPIDLMLRLVDDVTDLCKLEQGNLTLNQRTFDLNELFHNISSATELQIKQRNDNRSSSAPDALLHPASSVVTEQCCCNPQQNESVTFTYNIDTNVPNLVIADDVRILQITYNILSNATKFTKFGSIDFGVSCINYDEAVASNLVTTDSSPTSGKIVEEEERGTPGSWMNAGSIFSLITHRQLVSTANHDDDVTRMLLAKPTHHHSVIDTDNDERIGLEHQRDHDYSTAANNSNQIVLKIVVHDTGPGISSDRIKNIIDPYSQNKLSDYRIHGGTGLGLAIVTKLIDSMRGSMHIESTEGEGSKFTVFLPMLVLNSNDNMIHMNDPEQEQDVLSCLNRIDTDDHDDPNVDTEGTDHDAKDYCYVPSSSNKSTGNYNVGPQVQIQEGDDQIDVSNDTRISNSDEASSESDLAPRFRHNTSNVSVESDHNDSCSLSCATTNSCSTSCEDGQEFRYGGEQILNNDSTKVAGYRKKINESKHKTVKICDNSTISSPSTIPAIAKVKTLSITPSLKILPPQETTVLVVDDNALNCKLLCRMLSYFGIENKVAMNGLEAVDIIMSSRNVTGNVSAPRFGLIIMDMQMPIMDGAEAIRILRSHRINLPIIALTANALDEMRQKAIDAGATEFATKPILRQDLYNRCCHYLLTAATSSTPSA